MSPSQNRIWNVGNPHQNFDKYKRVLCVCSAGLLRSPTAALILSTPPFSFNTRAAGCDSGHALIPVDAVLIKWADEIVCMEQRHVDILSRDFDLSDTPTYNLNIQDDYGYRDPKLIELITKACNKITNDKN